VVGKTVLSKADFCAGWLKAEEDGRGVVLLFETTGVF